jgi:hypothetical protein
MPAVNSKSRSAWRRDMGTQKKMLPATHTASALLGKGLLRRPID